MTTFSIFNGRSDLINMVTKTLCAVVLLLVSCTNAREPHPTPNPISVTPSETDCLPADPDKIYIVDTNHPDANDNNPGTESLPWKTMVHGANQATAGDTVYVKRGTYSDGRVDITHSGAPDNHILFAAYPGDERLAIQEGNSIRIASGNSHIQICYFKVQQVPYGNIGGSFINGRGIYAKGRANPSDPPNSGILIYGNHTEDTGSSGIAIWGAPWGDDPGDYNNIRDIRIQHNIIELAVHGGYNECLTIANGVHQVDISYNHIIRGDNDGIGDEGIDIKEHASQIYIHHNIIGKNEPIFDNAIYIDAGRGTEGFPDPVISDVYIYNNDIYPGLKNGIVVTTEGRGDIDGVTIMNNVITGRTSNGIMVYEHPYGAAPVSGSVNDVKIINNTTVGNGLEHTGYGNIRVDHNFATNIVIANNLMWNGNGYDLRINNDPETTFHNNFCGQNNTGCEIVAGDPGFVDESGRDFHLMTHSPAFDVGTDIFSSLFDYDFDDAARPASGAWDIGAFEQ